MIKKKIKRAIISVSDKSNLKLILPTLKKFNIEIISSGGSYKKIKSMGHNCIEVSDYTGFSEIDRSGSFINSKLLYKLRVITNTRNYSYVIKIFCSSS